MFKVMCIESTWIKSHKERNCPSPVYGGIYTVTKTKDFNGYYRGEIGPPGLYYQLAEMNPQSGFHSKFFVRLSDIDETEMIREYQTQTV